MLLRQMIETVPVEVTQHAQWDTLYCCDMVITQQALKDGHLTGVLHGAVPEVGALYSGKLLLDTVSTTDLTVLRAQTQMVRMAVHRRYFVLPCFTVHVRHAYAHAVEDLRKHWIGEQYILVENRAENGGYSALVARAALTSVHGWAVRHEGAVVKLDDRMKEYDLTITVEQVENLLRVPYLLGKET